MVAVQGVAIVSVYNTKYVCSNLIVRSNKKFCRRGGKRRRQLLRLSRSLEKVCLME